MTLFFHVSAATANYDSSLCNIELNNNFRISKQYKIMKFEFQAPKNTVQECAFIHIVVCDNGIRLPLSVWNLLLPVLK